MNGVNYLFIILLVVSLMFCSCDKDSSGPDNAKPEVPTNPHPSMGATNQSLAAVLFWNCNDSDEDDLTYDVYFSPENYPELIEEDVTTTMLSLAMLEENITYYWKVIASDGELESESEIWSFTTGSVLKPGKMIFVEGSSFQMGDHFSEGNWDELPVHEVTISNFYIGQCEVTQAEYQELMGNNPSYFGGYKKPVERVTWFDVTKYCNKKSINENLTPCYSVYGDTNPDNWGNSVAIECNWDNNGYRLPTEAEWEYAARGGIHWTDDYKYSGTTQNHEDYVWCDGGPYSETLEVGSKLPNQLGIYNMSGNVQEWCFDYFDSDYYNFSSNYNPTGHPGGSCRVLRGGDWLNRTGFCRVANRGYSDPNNYDNFLGFRIVKTTQ